MGSEHTAVHTVFEYNVQHVFEYSIFECAYLPYYSNGIQNSEYSHVDERCHLEIRDYMYLVDLEIASLLVF